MVFFTGQRRARLDSGHTTLRPTTANYYHHQTFTATVTAMTGRAQDTCPPTKQEQRREGDPQNQSKIWTRIEIPHDTCWAG